LAEEQSSYRQIFKATSLFGGVQVFQILIQIIRAKFVAVLLGPVGMGIQGLLSSNTGLIAGLTNFGLGISAVKNVAEANATSDHHRIAIIVTVLRKLVWITGLLGVFITIALSSWLSELSFGNKDYTLAFVWISVTLLFNQLSSGQLVVLQGLRKLKYLAKANLIGALLGLLVSIPFYYFFGINGIVPAIIGSSIIALLISWYFAQKVKIEKVQISRQIIVFEGKDMLKMGFVLSISSLITIGTSYFVRIFISNVGSIEDVGLYNAGFAILSSYVGLVFTAMATDYYPRLAGVSHDNKQSNALINHQAEIAVLILGPILSVFLIFINWIVLLLYSAKFVAISGMIHFAALGIYFKAASWAIAFVMLAKGASKLFFYSELFSTLYVLFLNLIGYYFLRLDGLGISFLLGYLIYLLQVFIITKKKFQFSFTREFYKVFFPQLMLGILCFLSIKIFPTPWAYVAGTLLMVISFWFSFVELNKRIDLKSLIINRIKRLQKG